MPEAEEPVTVELTADEALVVFEWLHRCEDEGAYRQPEHRGELVALWNLSAALERTLVQPFQSDYASLVDQARSRLAGAGRDT